MPTKIGQPGDQVTGKPAIFLGNLRERKGKAEEKMRKESERRRKKREREERKGNVEEGNRINKKEGNGTNCER